MVVAVGQAATKFAIEHLKKGGGRGPLRHSQRPAPHHFVVAKVHTDMGR